LDGPYNRSRLGIAKSHALDAACVGEVGTLVGWQIPSTEIKATGGGDYCRTNVDRRGFSRGYYTRAKRVRGFQTGDMVRAAVPRKVCMLEALRCVSPALSESATQSFMPGAFSPAERALRPQHPRGGCGETWAITRGSSPELVALGAAVFAGERLDWVAVLGLLLVGGGIVSVKHQCGVRGRLSGVVWS
jgi:hypothetical protein